VKASSADVEQMSNVLRGSSPAPVKRPARRGCGRLLLVASLLVGTLTVGSPSAVATGAKVPGGGVLRVVVGEAIGGKTVLGQLTVDSVRDHGFVTAYGCSEGIPRNPDGSVSRSDLNFNGLVSPVWSNRLIVQADEHGAVCFYTHRSADLIVDINAVSHDTGISSFPNRRTDTRGGGSRPRPRGHVLRVRVPEARGAQTVIGQLTVDAVSEPGFLTAFACADGLPRDARGRISRSDLNFDGRVSPAWSNRLIVQADADGEICFYTDAPAHLIVDVNGVAASGIESFANRRIDTRDDPGSRLGSGGVMRVTVPEAVGGKTVIGQLTIDRLSGQGFMTAYPCAGGLPRDRHGAVTRSDLNFDGRVSPFRSNRLVVQADALGRVCVYAHRPTDVIIDINAVSSTGIFSFANRRIDTRQNQPVNVLPAPPNVDGVPQWPFVDLRPPMSGVAALTGQSASAAVARRPIVAVKIDNFRLARPQAGLDQADAVIEMNVEGMTRFIALFQTHHPVSVGPVRSARTADLDVVQAMNRPVFAYSGANPGVTAWVQSAASSGGLVDFSAMRRGCYRRAGDRRAPHNLILDARCAVSQSRTAGSASALWAIDGAWRPSSDSSNSASRRFVVPMTGVRVEWAWDASNRRYQRFQDGQPHRAASGAQLNAQNVVVLETAHPPSVVDARSPHPLTTGAGRGVLHRNGRAIEIQWRRSSVFDRFEFFESGTGRVVALDRGVTFMMFVRPS